MRREFWEGKRVFLTGHTGFKGSWLSTWLQDAGTIVTGFSLLPNTQPNLFDSSNVSDQMESVIADIRNFGELSKAMKDSSPEIVIHMAAQPIVRESYDDPLATYSTNVLGTANLLQAVRQTPSIKAVINVTTDKCYENKERLAGYREDDEMGGHDPYSSSKGCSELVTASFRRSFFFHDNSANIATARAGNVIGGGDWARDRLVPDVLRTLQTGGKIDLRNPDSTRPWQHVLEPLSGYLTLAEKLYEGDQSYASAWNFGPEEEGVQPVRVIVEYLLEKLGDGATWEHTNTEQPHEAKLLKLDISKAKKDLGWRPRWDLYRTLDAVVSWHQGWLGKKNVKSLMLNQIIEFESTQTSNNGR